MKNLLCTATLGIKIKRCYPSNQSATKSQKLGEMWILGQCQKKDKDKDRENDNHRQHRLDSLVHSLCYGF